MRKYSKHSKAPTGLAATQNIRIQGSLPGPTFFMESAPWMKPVLAISRSMMAIARSSMLTPSISSAWTFSKSTFSFSRIFVAAARSFSAVAIVLLSSSIFASAAPIFAVSSAMAAEARSEAPFPVLISKAVSFDSSLQKSVNSSYSLDSVSPSLTYGLH